MSQIKLGLRTMPVPDKIQFGRQLAMAMTGNPEFPNPVPDLATLTNGVNQLETSYNDAQAARQLAKMKTSVQDDAAAALDLLVSNLANYVESTSNGDKAQIESAGFSVRNPSAPIGVLPAPTAVQVLPSEHAGSAEVSWTSGRGAKSYCIERAEDAPAPEYAVIGNSTKKEASLNSMVSGKKYWFRVAAVGAAGQSAWSDPVPLFAP